MLIRLSASPPGGSRINYIAQCADASAMPGSAADLRTGASPYGQVNDSISGASACLLGGVSTSQNYTRTAGPPGAGVEYAITNNITLKTGISYSISDQHHIQFARLASRRHQSKTDGQYCPGWLEL